MKILFTCFKGKNNSSYQLLSKITGDKLYLTNSFEGLERDITNMLDIYDLVVMFGLDKNLKSSIRMETVAEFDGYKKTTKIDVSKFKELFDMRGIKCTISFIPAKYLCNSAYLHMLHKTDGRTLFIHIPPLKSISEGMMEKLVNCIEEMNAIIEERGTLYENQACSL